VVNIPADCRGILGSIPGDQISRFHHTNRGKEMTMTMRIAPVFQVGSPAAEEGKVGQCVAIHPHETEFVDSFANCMAQKLVRRLSKADVHRQ